MKTFTTSAFAALLPVLMSALPIAARDEKTFSLIAIHSTDPNVHLQSINANGGLFWVGKPTTSFCPDSAEISCPLGTTTALVGSIGENVFISTSHEVPGEQSVYVQGPDASTPGALTFNPAHSSPPTGSIVDQFTLTDSDLEYTSSWFACPAMGAYYITAVTDGDFCISVNLHVVDYNGPTPAAWQYS